MEVIEAINELSKLDLYATIIGVFVILAVIISIYEISKKTCEIFNIPVKWIKKKNEDHELIIENARHISELSERHERDEQKFKLQNEEINKKLNNLTNMILDKAIDDYRFEILDFCSALSNGRKYNREAFNHIFSVYKKYENILAENGMENGLVEESIKFIREKYNEQLNNRELD